MARFLTIISGILVAVICFGATLAALEEASWEDTVTPSVKRLILGDSHAQPLFFSDGITIAKGGDPFVVSYLMLRRILKTQYSEQIRHILLTVGPQNFSSTRDDFLISNYENWFSGNKNRIAHILKWSDYLNISTPKIPLRSCFVHEFNAFNRTLDFSPAQWDEEPRLDSAYTALRLSRHRVTEPGWFQNQSLQVEYLNRLILLTDEYNCSLVLLGVPLHETYLANTEPTGLKKYYDFLDSIAQSHHHVEYWKYEASALPDSMFKDCDHLNSNGAKHFLKRIDNQVRQLHQTLP